MDEKAFRELVSNYMDADAYFNVLSKKERTFRVNQIKISLDEFLKFSELSCNQDKAFNFIFRCDEDVKLGRTLEYFLGYIHTQSYSSILPPLVLNPKPHSNVLDIAAAPGGKTTEMADLMGNTGFILAVDNKYDRIKMLVANLRRLGVLNTAVLNADGRKLSVKNFFDFALVDAPCSSLGSSLTPSKWWKPAKSRDFARIQRKLLLSAFDTLKEGGTLVYSTCTFIEKENEGVVAFLLSQRENAKILNIDLPVKHSPGFSDFGKELRKTWRIYPEHVESEAFYIAKIKKV